LVNSHSPQNLSSEFLNRYLCHVIEQAFQLVESKLDHRIESYFNIQACQNEGTAAKLEVVEAVVSELTVTQHEEKDGRINEGYYLILKSSVIQVI
jgi:hypothetical protein